MVVVVIVIVAVPQVERRCLVEDGLGGSWPIVGHGAPSLIGADAAKPSCPPAASHPHMDHQLALNWCCKQPCLGGHSSGLGVFNALVPATAAALFWISGFSMNHRWAGSRGRPW